MKSILFAFLFTLISLPVSAGDSNFLLGQWHNEKFKLSEYWFRAGPDLMLGLGFSEGEERTFFDYFRIESREEGLVYIAQPFGNPPTVFKQKPTNDGSLAFVNPDHDYPQMIVYEKTIDGIKTTISLINGENARSWTFKIKE